MVLCDDKLFLGARDPAMEEISSEAKSLGAQTIFQDMNSSNRSVRPEFVAFAGLGIAVLSLVVSYLRLRSTDGKIDSFKALKEEIDAYLKLRGIDNYDFVFSDGVENLLSKDGKPVVVCVRLPDQDDVEIYFGVTRDRIWVSSLEVDYTKLN